MDLSKSGGANFYLPPFLPTPTGPTHYSEGVPLFYQPRQLCWPQPPQCQIVCYGSVVEQQLVALPAPPPCNLNADATQNQNIVHFDVPPGPNLEQPQPSFFLAQRTMPQSFRNLPSLPPISLMPPTQPHLLPELSASQQLPPSSDPPFRFVNIEIPGSELTQPYIVSIPVPLSEFSPMSFSNQQLSPASSVGQVTPPHFVPSPSPFHRFQLVLPSIWGQEHQGRMGRRKQPQERTQRSSSEESGASRDSRRGSKNGFVGYPDPCKLCQKNKETKRFCLSHTLRDISGKVNCPILRAHVCRLCGATGDNAHTLKYCPRQRSRREGAGNGYRESR